MNRSRFRALLLATLTALIATLALAGYATAVNGPQYGSIGQYGEAFRGGGFDSCWFDGGKYDGKGCATTETQPAAGEFVDPVGFTTDNSGTSSNVFVLDRVTDLPGNVTNSGSGGVTTWRLQEISGSGSNVGTVLGTDEFSLPTANLTYCFDQSTGKDISCNNCSNNPNCEPQSYPQAPEVAGLAVDPSTGVVYTMLTENFNVGTPSNFTEGTGLDEVLAWSTTPTSGVLGPPSGATSDTVSVKVGSFPVPAVVSTAGNLVNALNGIPKVQQPTGIALDVSGTKRDLAVESTDDTTASTPAGTGIAQISTTNGAITVQWSANSLSHLTLSSDTIGVLEAGVPMGISTLATAADGSGPLIVLIDGGSPAAEDDVDAIELPATLPSNASGAVALSTGDNEVFTPLTIGNSVTDLPFQDDSAIDTSEQAPYTSDPDGQTAGANTASAQVVGLSNGLFASEWEPDAINGQLDANNPSGGPGIWTAHDPGVRLLQPESDGTLSNNAPPMTSLFDTLGNTAVNSTGQTAADSACGLLDSTTDGAGTDLNPTASLAAGINGAVWVLTRGYDSSGGGTTGSSSDTPAQFTGARQLIELAPGVTPACPGASGTFTEKAGSSSEPGGSTPLTVTVGTTVTFDASTISNNGAATAAYDWNFGDGNKQTVGPQGDTYVSGTITPPEWPATTVTHQYTAAGSYTVTMDLFGDYGEYVETGKVDVVNASGAAASFNANPSNATVAQTVSFDGSASTPSTGATISDYTWDFGDGTGDDSGATPTDTHAYSAPGTYTVKLTITDSNSETNSTTETVTVTAQTTTTTSTTTTGPPPPTTSTSTSTSTNTGPPPPPSNNFAVTGTTAHGSDIVVNVSVPDAGRVEAKGAFKITVSKKVKHGKKTKTVKSTKLITFADVTQSVAGGMATLTLAPSASAVSALKGISKHSTVSVGLIIAFTPNGGTLNAKAASVNVKGLQAPKKKKKK